MPPFVLYISFAVLLVLLIGTLFLLLKISNQIRSTGSGSLNQAVIAETQETRGLVNDLRQRMALVQSANHSVQRLANQVGDLERVLSDKSARGAFGEQQMADVLRAILPPHLLSFQHTLSNGKRVDCLLRLPGPPGALTIDSKFPLESYQDFMAAETPQEKKDAKQKLERHVSNHLKDIANRYIVPGETADQALMFLPSEAVFACLHAEFRQVIDLSHRLRVFIVSPATCAALITSIRGVLRDTLLSQNLRHVQGEIDALSADLNQLSDHLDALDRHYALMGQDLERMHKLTSSLQTRAHRIDQVSLQAAKPTAQPLNRSRQQTNLKPKEVSVSYPLR